MIGVRRTLRGIGLVGVRPQTPPVLQLKQPQTVKLLLILKLLYALRQASKKQTLRARSALVMFLLLHKVHNEIHLV
jgi:hypothetical protein